jgi:type III pantothenate kinase
MLLAVDIGSTNVKLGVYAGSTLVTRWRVPSDREALADQWWVTLRAEAEPAEFDLAAIDSVCLSSTAPAVTPALTRMLRERLGLEPLVARTGVTCGLTLAVDFPDELGADRLLDAAAAYALFGGPIIVVDFGTATTCNIVSSAGAFVGGAIAPGAQIALDALIGASEQLRAVPLTPPARVIGRNSVEALQAGTLLGYADMVSRLLARIDIELGAPARVVSTGGAGELFTALCPRIEQYLPYLTLEGLRIVWEMNGRGGAAGDSAGM